MRFSINHKFVNSTFEEKLMNKKVLLAAFVCSVSSTVFAGDATYRALDENKDGYVSPEEAEAIPTLAEQWEKVDVNEDGKIDAAEFSSFESLSVPGHMHSAPEGATEKMEE
jgi:Ca2+-binding EF-hand superfamily protein